MTTAIGAFLIETSTGEQLRGFFWSELVEIRLASGPS
jgi:hypothetical protein